jgi:hypothetical protein
MAGTHWVYELTSMLLKQATTYNSLEDDIKSINIDRKTERELQEMTEYPILHSHHPLRISLF